MKRKILPLLLLIASLCCGALPGTAQAAVELDPQTVSRKAYEILNRHCYQCHGPKAAYDIDIRDRESVLAWMTPGNPDESDFWKVIANDKMPKGVNKLSYQEKEIIQTWIKQGAEYPDVQGRTFVSEVEICRAVENDLRLFNQSDRFDLRYFSLANLHNNRSVTEWEMRLYRAALSKLVNSLNIEGPRIVVPKAIDENQLVFRIDLRDYGWNRQDWLAVVKGYPYGLRYQDREVERIHENIRNLFGISALNVHPYIRADWFVHKASRPPLYHRLLELPEEEKDLERTLGVDVARNFTSGRAGVDIARAGFSESIPSVANRVVERHESKHGAYWKSYDFGTSSGRKNIFRRPLGPNLAGNNLFDTFGFDHDGGETVFNLPNGLQGYLITDAEGKRIDKAPITVVRDLDEVSGTPEVVNGISCLTCHDRGIKRFTDAIRSGFRGGDRAAEDKVAELYIEVEEMNKLLDLDTAIFKRALERACGQFLQVDEDADRDIFDFEEPIKKLVQRYQDDLTFEEVAVELGLSDPDFLKKQIAATSALKDLGLGPIADDRTIKREIWESTEEGSSLYQQSAKELEVAIEPVIQ